MSIRSRFLKYVRKSPGCWTWTGFLIKSGYGRFSWSSEFRSMYAHRASWMIFHGEIPTTLMVLHRCDNPSCVRPSHLFLGTALTNAQDREAKGRRNPLCGEEVHWTKLKATQVQQIRVRYLGGEFQKDIAKDFSVSQGLISKIVNGKNWRTLPCP